MERVAGFGGWVENKECHGDDHEATESDSVYLPIKFLEYLGVVNGHAASNDDSS